MTILIFHDGNLERMLNKDNVHFIDLLTKSKWFKGSSNGIELLYISYLVFVFVDTSQNQLCIQLKYEQMH